MTITIVGLFGLGLWMTSLGYYDAWYNQAPSIHKSIGILLAGVFIFRVIWKLTNIKLQPLSTHTAIEKKLAQLTHVLLYVLMACIMVSGYLISTADGRVIEVFGWFEIPATLTNIENQEDIAGEVHYYLALTLISLSTIHALAAIKHHVIDKDETLRRMTSLTNSNTKTKTTHKGNNHDN
ncbi:cytochrome B [Gammaproteobacteria bacterium 42_54_T18]|nr:cytochrome B [Gammaproteobacteria bacterium 42_54_T18]